MPDLKTYDVFQVVDGQWTWVREARAVSQQAVINAIDEPGRYYVSLSYGMENIMLPTHVPTDA